MRTNQEHVVELLRIGNSINNTCLFVFTSSADNTKMLKGEIDTAIYNLQCLKNKIHNND